MKLLTTRQTAEILGIHINTVHEYIKAKKLKAHKLGGNGKSKRHWRIRIEDLEAFVNGSDVRSEHAEASRKDGQEQVAGLASRQKEMEKAWNSGSE